MTAHDDSADATALDQHVFQVDAPDAGARLDVFLAAHLTNISRARLQRLIADDGVTLNDRVVAKPAHKLRAGDRIELEIHETNFARELAPENIPLDIVYEDNDLLVVNKSAGLIVHPGAGAASGTLANALAHHFAQLPKGSDSTGGALRPGIVHRIDRDTSGLLVVAKTETAHENLSDQFRARTIFKSYVALAHGVFKTESGRIDEPLGRDPRHRTRMAVVRGARSALTLYRVQWRYARLTLLDVEIKTGRTHQIRVHLAWLKHPVVGDELYGAGRDQTVTDAQLRARIGALDRQFLHAEKLGFRHPRSGDEMFFTAPLPPELSDFLANIA